MRKLPIPLLRERLYAPFTVDFRVLKTRQDHIHEKSVENNALTNSKVSSVFNTQYNQVFFVVYSLHAFPYNNTLADLFGWVPIIFWFPGPNFASVAPPFPSAISPSRIWKVKSFGR